MSELLRKAVEKARILRARPHLKPVAAGGGEVSEAERWRTAQMAQDWLNANADPKYHRRRLPDMEENGQFKLLTRGRLGMRHEFKSYDKTGDEERRDFLRAGIVGTGLAAAGGLAGLGLYTAGVSGAAKKAARLAQVVKKVSANKAAGVRNAKAAMAAAATEAAGQKSAYEKAASKFYGNGGAFDKDVSAVARAQAAKAKAAAQAAKAAKAAPAPRGRPPKTQSNTPPPAPPQTPAPTPPPQAPPAATKPQTPPPEGKAPKTKVVKDLNQSGDLSTADAAAEVEEITAAKAPRKLTAKQQKLAKRQAKVAKAAAAAQSGGTPSVSSTPAPAAPVAVVPKTAPVAAKIETPAANTTKTLPTKPVASATNEEFWESGGKKIPLTGTAAERAALRGELDKVSASDGFKGQTAGDVIDAARARATASLKSDFPPNLSAQLRAAGKENNPKPKAKRKSKESKSKKEADDADDLDEDDLDDLTEGGVSPEEADWEAKLKENPQVRTKKTSAKAAAKAPAAKKPAASGGKKAKKEAAPLSFADKIAAKVKAKRDEKKNLSALLSRVRYFNQLQTDEGGIPLTGRVPRDRFVKKLRDEDLDRRDANILRAGGAGALAGLMARGRIHAGRRALIGAGIGGLGVVGIRQITNNGRDIYGERNRGSKRAELIPAVGGLGAAAWLAGKRFKAFAKKFNHGGHGEHGGGLREFVRGDYMAKLLPSERWIKRSDPRGWVQNEVLPAPDKHSAYSKYVADKMRAMRRLNSGNIPYTQRAKKPVGWLSGAQAQLPSYYFSSRLRGVKNFDDYRLYYFKGRNTGIAAKSVEEARSKKKRGGDELVAVRTPNATEKSQMARGVWVRTRRDGKSPDQSRYGKGRGQGPARKSLSAKLRVRFFEKRDRREKRELNPYVGAALSGGVSGAGLGALSWLKRGTSVASAGKTAAKLGALSAGVVGGGALLGSKIVGDPREEESAPFMKRAALGGAITGALVGGAGGLLLRNTKLVREAAKTWRPAKWIVDAPVLGAGALGAVGGAFVGGAQGADEGQQVDSIRNIRKDIRQKNFSSLREFRAFPAIAAKQLWKTDPALRADFVKRIVAKVKGAVAANKKQYGVKEFQVSPLNVESMAQTKERRSTERARFLKTTGIIAGMGLAGLGGYRVARVLGKAELRAAKSAAKAAESDTERMKIRADRYQGQAEVQRRRADNAERRWYQENNSTSGSASSGSSSGFDWENLFRTGGRSKSYDDDYVRRSQQARQQSRSSGAGSNSGASSNSGAQGVKNPYAGTPKAEAWEKWKSMDRMAKESPHEGERMNAAMARDKWKKRHNLARKLRGLKMFGRDDQPRYRESKAWADPIMGWVRGDDLVDKGGNKWSPSSPQLVNAMHNKARGIRVNVQRGAGLAGDTTAVLQGKDRERDASGRIKKREWEKAWFRNAVTTAGLTVAGLAGAGAWRYGRMNPKTTLGKFVTNTESGVRRTKDDIKSGLGRIMGAADDATGPKKFSAKLKKLREFDLFASAAGWDARDPRGRSVRVYAPGSRTRVRREKYWHEKTENQRKLMIAAGVGAAALGGLGGVAAYRLAKGKSLVPSFMLKKPPVPMEAPPVPVMVRRQDGKFAPNAKNPVTGKKERPYADRPYVQSEEEKRKLRDYFADGGNSAA